MLHAPGRHKGLPICAVQLAADGQLYLCPDAGSRALAHRRGVGDPGNDGVLRPQGD